MHSFLSQHKQKTKMSRNTNDVAAVAATPKALIGTAVQQGLAAEHCVRALCAFAHLYPVLLADMLYSFEAGMFGPGKQHT